MALSAALTQWLRFLRPAQKPPRRPRPDDDVFSDFTFGTLGGVSAAMTPEDLQGILDAANDGYSAQQAVLIQEMQEKEPVIAAHLGTRKGAVTASPWTVDAGEGARQKEAKELTAMLRDAGLDAAIAHLCDYVATGYAAVLPSWTEGGGAVTGFREVAPEVFEFDQGGNVAFKDKAGKMHPLAAEHPAQFLTVYSRAKPGLPCRNGLGRALVWLYLFKHSGMAGAARYVEKFGSPFMYATIPGGQWGDRATVLANLKAIGRDHVGVLKEGGTVEMLKGAEGGSTDAQMRFLEYCDEVFALTILGQLATSGDAGGLSKGQAQENVRMDLLASDARAIMDAINRGLILPLCQMRYGWADTQGVTFSIEYEPEADLDALATRWKVLTEVTGRPMDVAATEEQFGVKFGAAPAAAQPGAVGPGAGAAETATSAMQGAGEAGGGSDDETEFEEGTTPDEAPAGLNDTLTLADVPRAVSALDLVAADALAQYVRDPEAREAWLGPVQAAIREAFGDLKPGDVEGFKARIPLFQASLPRVLEAMDSAGLEQALAAGMLAAAVNGAEEGAAGQRPFAGRVALYDPGQARDDWGRWTGGVGGAHLEGLQYKGQLRNRLAEGGDYGRVQVGTKTIPAREAGQTTVKTRGGGTRVVDIKAAPERTVPVHEWRKADGTPVSEEEATALKKLGIPPAARNVRATLAEDATNWGSWKDEAGRQQVRRSLKQEELGKARKLERTRRFAAEVPEIRSRVMADQQAGRAEAMVFEIEDRTAIRLGNPAEGVGKVKAYGLTTLEGRHASVDGDTVKLAFVGKHGVENASTFTDAALARFVADRKAAAGDGGKLWPDVTPGRFDGYVKEVSGGKYSTKDFRTYHASRLAFDVVKPHAGKVLAVKEKRAIVKAAAEAASSMLNNSPGMALKSYIDPAVFDLIGGR